LAFSVDSFIDNEQTDFSVGNGSVFMTRVAA